MATVTPFTPYRYAASAGPLEHLVTQPYDKISPEMRERYLALSPHNVVRVILGERLPSDSETDSVYTRAAGLLDRWIASGVLVRETEPAFYAYFQDFVDPDTGDRVTRQGFIGLGNVEDYSAGVVYRHEQTLAGPKKDRLALLRATKAHFGQLFMLYTDPEGAIDRLLADLAESGGPDAVLNDEYGARHRVWRVAGTARTAEIQRLMEGKKLLIADGHHRYETALAFRDENQGWEPATKVMMTFVNMHSKGLRILATHRLVHGLPGFSAEGFLAKAQACGRLSGLDGLDALKAAWAQPHAGRILMGIVCGTPARVYLLDAERREDGLDVPFLHDAVLDGVLGITPAVVREETYTRYARGVDKAADAVERGEAQIAFLLEPTSIEQVAGISFSGGVMPQKSTDFYPKLLSGLTIYKLD